MCIYIAAYNNIACMAVIQLNGVGQGYGALRHNDWSCLV
jgi:hypothetical protein